MSRVPLAYGKTNAMFAVIGSPLPLSRNVNISCWPNTIHTLATYYKVGWLFALLGQGSHATEESKSGCISGGKRRVHKPVLFELFI